MQASMPVIFNTSPQFYPNIENQINLIHIYSPFLPDRREGAHRADGIPQARRPAPQVITSYQLPPIG
jgi:hypothetical protein